MFHEQYKENQTETDSKIGSVNQTFPEEIYKHLNSKFYRKKFKAYLEECNSKLVIEMFKDLGAVPVRKYKNWIIAWSDVSLSVERLHKFKSFQRSNHFPGMNELCKKDFLSQNLKRMKDLLPDSYDFFPPTFCLPIESRNLAEYCAQRKKRTTYIIKPENSSQGIGIILVSGSVDIKKYNKVIVQKYIQKPLLLDTFKFDIRLYVLISSLTPLRIYVYNEGLVRMATIPYKEPKPSNLAKKRMHLTNFSVNKITSTTDENLFSNDDCKKSLSDLGSLLRSVGSSLDKLWSQMDDIIVKTIASALPSLRDSMRIVFPKPNVVSPCFELLGFDILLDRFGKPYLLEVNRSPSLSPSSKFDRELKQNLVRNVLKMVLLSSCQVRTLEREERVKCMNRLTGKNNSVWTSAEMRVAEQQIRKEARKMERFRLLYPTDDDRYEEICSAAVMARKFSSNR